MAIYTKKALDAKYFPAGWRMNNHININIWRTNKAFKNSKIPLALALDEVARVSTGWGGIGQASRHVVEVFLRGRSDVAIVL